MKKISAILLCLFIATLVFTNACKKDDNAPNPPANPFTKETEKTDTSKKPDPYSIVGLHSNIFNTKCNMPGCHDGTFEPDFRTVQSTYSTLVYATSVKTTVDNSAFFQYRVIPGDTLHSFLHDRVTTKTSFYMPSNGVRLSRTEIEQINKWIMNGAKDMYGNSATEPDTLPRVMGFIAVDLATGKRVDSVRQNNDPANPFLVQKSQTVRFYFFCADDKTEIKNLTINTMKLSLDPNSYSQATSHITTYLEAGDYKLYYFDLAVTTLTTNAHYYLRYYVSDGKHGNQQTEFPNSYSVPYLKNVFSFIVQP